MQQADFEHIVRRAQLAPSVHNIQPARFRLTGDVILIGGDLGTTLPAGDPDGRDAGLSCGASIEAAVLVLSEMGHAVTVDDLWEQNNQTTLPGTRCAARLTMGGRASPDPLAAALDKRFTFRGAFGGASATALTGWTPDDAVLITALTDKDWIATENDRISLATLRQTLIRHELLHWMRLSPRHHRYPFDGMNRDALRLSAPLALGAKLTLGPLWSLCDGLGLTPAITTEANATVTATAIACFHRPADESPVSSGRAYLRLCLSAAQRGLSGWPMAALADDPVTRTIIAERFHIGPERRLIQVIRFGPATAPMPPRARRPLTEVIV